jgi:hypothetical protein
LGKIVKHLLSVARRPAIFPDEAILLSYRALHRLDDPLRLHTHPRHPREQIDNLDASKSLANSPPF